MRRGLRHLAFALALVIGAAVVSGAATSQFIGQYPVRVVVAGLGELARWVSAGLDLGAKALLFGSAFGTSDTRFYRSATKTVTFDDGAGGAATLAVTGALTTSGNIATNAIVYNSTLTPLSGTVSIGSTAVIASTLKTIAVAVASLPTCDSNAKGTRHFVTDANATTFMSTVAAGGANNVPVVCDGTNWKIG